MATRLEIEQMALWDRSFSSKCCGAIPMVLSVELILQRLDEIENVSGIRHSQLESRLFDRCLLYLNVDKQGFKPLILGS
jgi:hypothetical protein